MLRIFRKRQQWGWWKCEIWERCPQSKKTLCGNFTHQEVSFCFRVRRFWNQLMLSPYAYIVCHGYSLIVIPSCTALYKWLHQLHLTTKSHISTARCQQNDLNQDMFTQLKVNIKNRIFHNLSNQQSITSDFLNLLNLPRNPKLLEPRPPQPNPPSKYKNNPSGSKPLHDAN